MAKFERISMGEEAISRDPMHATSRITSIPGEYSDEQASHIIAQMKQKRHAQAQVAQASQRRKPVRQDFEEQYQEEIYGRLEAISKGEKKVAKTHSLRDYIDNDGSPVGFEAADPISAKIAAINREEFGDDDDGEQYYVRERYASSNRIAGLLEEDVETLENLLMESALADAEKKVSDREAVKRAQNERIGRSAQVQRNIQASFEGYGSPSDYARASVTRQDGSDEETIDSRFGMVDKDRISKVLKERERIAQVQADSRKTIRRASVSKEERRAEWENRELQKSRKLNDIYSNNFLMGYLGEDDA